VKAPSRRDRLQQPLAFLAIGLTSAAIDGGVFLALHHLGLPPAAASAVSFLSAFLVNYRGNRDFVFKAGQASGALPRYITLVAINLGLSSAGVWLLVHGGLQPWAAKLTTIITIAAINFVAMRLWVFPAQEQTPDPDRPAR
jgi:putative flippase GtrA